MAAIATTASRVTAAALPRPPPPLRTLRWRAASAACRRRRALAAPACARDEPAARDAAPRAQPLAAAAAGGGARGTAACPSDQRRWWGGRCWVGAEEWAEAYRIARTVCDVCGGGDEAKGNLILLCDGDGCDRALHMGCLDPPLKRMPAKNREWYCPTCRAQNKARGGLPPPEPPSLYEQQRLDNIARNQRILAELGLV